MKTIIQETLEENLADDEEITLADGFEKAFVGIARQFGKPFAVYDRAACIAALTEQEMSLQEAEEYMAYNTEGAWVGESTPAFMSFARTDEEQRIEKFTSALVRLLHVSQLLEAKCGVLKEAVHALAVVLERYARLPKDMHIPGTAEALQLAKDIEENTL